MDLFLFNSLGLDFFLFRVRQRVICIVSTSDRLCFMLERVDCVHASDYFVHHVYLSHKMERCCAEYPHWCDAMTGMRPHSYDRPTFKVRFHTAGLQTLPSLRKKKKGYDWFVYSNHLFAFSNTKTQRFPFISNKTPCGSSRSGCSRSGQ